MNFCWNFLEVEWIEQWVWTLFLKTFDTYWQIAFHTAVFGENIVSLIWQLGASLVAHKVKNLTAVWETWVRSLGQKDPLEKRTATHSSILVWRIPGTEELRGRQSMGSLRVRHDWATNTHLTITESKWEWFFSFKLCDLKKKKKVSTNNSNNFNSKLCTREEAWLLKRCFFSFWETVGSNEKTNLKNSLLRKNKWIPLSYVFK